MQFHLWTLRINLRNFVTKVNICVYPPGRLTIAGSEVLSIPCLFLMFDASLVANTFRIFLFVAD